MQGRCAVAGRCRQVKVWDDLKVSRPSAPGVKKRRADGLGYSYELVTNIGTRPRPLH